MTQSDSIKELATALSLAQGELKAVPFDKKNDFLKNDYATLGSVIESSRAILAKNGLAVSQLTVTELDRIGVTTILMHKSGEWISGTATLATGEERGKSSAQVAGSVITYLRRYSLASILGMYADEDTDGNHQQPAAKPAQKPAEPAPNGHKPEPEPVAAMSLDMAESELNSEKPPKRYGDIDSVKLAFMATELEKKLKTTALSAQDREDKQRKLAACKVILAHRTAQETLI